MALFAHVKGKVDGKLIHIVFPCKFLNYFKRLGIG